MKGCVAVLGAGMAGLAAAQRCRQLGADVTVYEKNAYVGGHASSELVAGFTFDEGPHVSFTKNPAIQGLFAAAVNGQYREFASIVTNYWRGHWVRHPAQCNLYGLPVDIVERCLVDFVRAYHAQEGPIRTYEDWLYRQFGTSFSEEFPFRYTRKYWTVEPREMATDWVGPRMYKPKLEEVVRGALAPTSINHHYITAFRYPTRGGFAPYVRAVGDGQIVRHGFDLLRLDVRRRELEFTNGRKEPFETVISSLPLPELIRRIKDVPSEVGAAADRLVCTSLVLIDIGIERSEGFPEAHWLYFYDEDVIFSRGSFPHVLAEANAPSGCGSIQLEVYHSRFAGLPCSDVLSRTIEDLQRTGLLRRDDKLLVARERRVPYANVLFNHERAASLAVVQAYLRDQGILCCGRYGLWGYHWTDEAIVSGWQAAELAVSRDKSGK